LRAEIEAEVMGNWLRRGDRVVIIAGNDKGKMGRVLRRVKDRIVVEGVNTRKKHLKKSQDRPQGQIASFEMAIHISNARACDEGGSAVRLRVRESKGTKELVYRKEGKDIVYRRIGGVK
jgi:large subunit ribosomal protein L24